MKSLLTALLLCLGMQAFGQGGIKIKVEELSKPKLPLLGFEREDALKNLIINAYGLNWDDIKRDKIDFPYGLIAHSQLPGRVVNFGTHSFFQGMYFAYADHRPFVISPDMIWLLISQGFARHVEANAEALRNRIVDFEGKISLAVDANKVRLDSPAKEWEKIFPAFEEQIAKNTKNNIAELLTSAFSTTTPAQRIASTITLMEAVEPYFEYVTFRIVCGIPDITLMGTPEDWQQILDKTKQLDAYGLKWWTKELEPILKEILRSAQGKVDKNFWRNMFKYHDSEKYGAGKVIDGWIVAFYPYNKSGKRNNLKELVGKDNLPEEVVKVDLKYVEVSKDGSTKETPLELWAGFLGLAENRSNFTLTPIIGWIVRTKDVDDKATKQSMQARNDTMTGGITLRVTTVPDILYKIGPIKSLNIYFTDSITIPDRFKELQIDHLSLTGKIDQPGIERLRNLLPDTRLVINNKLEVNQ